MVTLHLIKLYVHSRYKNLKIIKPTQDSDYQLYELVNDPEETEDLSEHLVEEKKDLIEKLKKALADRKPLSDESEFETRTDIPFSYPYVGEDKVKAVSIDWCFPWGK